MCSLPLKILRFYAVSGKNWLNYSLVPIVWDWYPPRLRNARSGSTSTVLDTSLRQKCVNLRCRDQSL